VHNNLRNCTEFYIMIHNLPDDFLRAVGKRMSGRDVARMACVNSQMNRATTDVCPWLRTALKGIKRVRPQKTPQEIFEYKNSLNTYEDVERWSRVCVETPSDVLRDSIKHQLRLREFECRTVATTSKDELTREQMRVVRTPPHGQVMAIQAFAGTGKTTTLQRYAEQWKDCRILYLAYNKALTDESKVRFRNLPHVDVMTIHSMALRSFGADEFELSKGIKPNETISHVCVDAFERYCSTDLAGLPENGPVRALWGMMFDTHKVPVTHDAYLKAFQRNRPKLDYDIILLDEVQDCTDCVLDLVLRQTHATRVLVGDAYQKIYGFRHVNEAFDYIRHNQPSALLFRLSVSFRMGFTMMSYVNVFLRRMYNANGFSDSKQNGDTRVRFFKQEWFRDANRLNNLCRGTVVLCRYNINLVKLMFVLCEQNKPFRLHGKSFDFEKEISIITNLTHLLDGNVSAMTREKMKRFSTIEELTDHYARQNNHTWRTRLRLYHHFGEQALVRMWRTAEEMQKTIDVDLILTTAHQSKGCEFDHVVLFDDFPIRDGDAHNILYVAMTRARKTIYLNDSLSAFYKKTTKPNVYTNHVRTVNTFKQCVSCHRTKTNRTVCKENDHEGIMENNVCELYEYVPMCNLCTSVTTTKSRPG
jgi:F-box protein, helicase, 18